MKRFLHHLFFPHESNNHRAKLLHHSSLAFFILFFFVAQFVFVKIQTNFPSVLGVKTDISTQQLLVLTNEQRQNNGFASLVLNDKLSKAAELKGENMLAKGYWAHNAPDGTTPWYFLRLVGYDYLYAGENLARGFTNSKDIVAAWMASPTHKENMLSPNYKEIGFAVMEGNLAGENTTLVVEMFGNTQSLPISQKQDTVQEQKAPNLAQTGQPHSVLPSAVIKNPLFNSNIIAQYFVIGVLILFIFVLIMDMIIVERKKIIRVVGHNIDHIVFFTFILLFVIFVHKGIIL